MVFGFVAYRLLVLAEGGIDYTHVEQDLGRVRDLVEGLECLVEFIVVVVLEGLDPCFYFLVVVVSIVVGWIRKRYNMGANTCFRDMLG